MPPTRAQAIASRQARIRRIETRIEWYGQQMQSNIRLGMQQRMKMATQLLRDKVVANISRPVTKTRVRTASGRSRTVVTDRSRPGEYPKADERWLIKSIFKEVHTESGRVIGRVGTTLDYGLYLETSPRLNRAFLLRTLNEERARLGLIIGGPTPRLPGDNF